MTGMPTGDGAASLSYDKGNRLTSFGSTTYSYDAPELMRFVNADVVEGSLAMPAALDRCAYANGSPVSRLDPFGRSAAAASAGHATLDLAGFVPVAGAAFDAVDGVWYAAEGDWANAGLSLLGADALSAAGKGAKAEKAVKAEKLSMTAEEILSKKRRVAMKADNSLASGETPLSPR